MCGGKGLNTIYKMEYTKDSFCSITQRFEELDSDGKVQPGNGGILTNPTGDGEQFVWTPRVEGDPFNMTAVRSKTGDMKGFRTFYDNPFAPDGLIYLSWNEETSILESPEWSEIQYMAVDK